tara:strand:+ start:64 stop:264 length:201 start_codon:yes stop_codon:yes gene_type:complete
MDRDNIIEEGLFDKLKNYFKDRKKYDRLTKILMKDPEWKKAYKDAEKAVDDYKNAMDKAMKKRGLK